MTFKISMFDLNKINQYKMDLIRYDGHLPYLLLSVFTFEDVEKRNDYLKERGAYENEVELLRFERRSDRRKERALYNFLTENPKFKDFIIED